MSIAGAMLIFFGCTAAGIIKAHTLGELDRIYCALISALGIMKSEISSRSAPLGEILWRLKSAGGVLLPFAENLCAGFAGLGERSFESIWCGSAEKCLQSISQRSMAALKALGSSIGRYDAAAQCAAIDRCVAELCSERELLRAGLRENKRMYIGMGGAAGLIISIMLI